MSDTLVSLALGAFACWIGFHIIIKSKHQLPLPPGPPGDPIIGHLRTMPSTDAQIVFHEWAKEHGDVVHLSLLGHHIIVLDSDQAAIDLLEKRSSLYSDRPSIVVYMMMGWVKDIALMRYGEEWRYHRKLIHSHFTESASREYEPLQLSNAYLLVQSLMENKGDFDHLLSRYSAAIILRINYGHQVVSDNDEYITMANESGNALRAGGPMGLTLVDFFPILRYFPSWFPGTHFANVARERKPDVEKLYTIPFDRTMEAIKEGTAIDSFLSRCVAAGNGQITKEEDAALRGAAAHLYAAGAETTWSTLATFILGILLYPDCQKRGQDEVDRVTGRDRLPTFEDRSSLPYVNAVVEEALRWNPSVPLGIPHCVTHDDTYRGMFIPKGSFVFANALGVARNAEVYQDPETFNPSRFLPKSKGGNGEPPLGAAFGYGRRICPGRHLATSSVFIAIATIFSTLHLSKAKDKNGNEITPKVEYITGLTSHPKSFPCQISLRSEQKRHLINEAVEATSD